MTAHCYDLATELPTFDFYSWLVTVAAKGATEIVIDSSGFRESVYCEEQLKRRVESIIRPGPALVGLPVRDGPDGDRSTTCRLEDFVAFNAAHKWTRLKSVLPPAKVKYTVTLRQQCRKSKYRNSNEWAWRRFAREIGARVIEDYDIEPMPLYERLALYAGAKMNFGVSGGPTFLLTLTDYPAMLFNFGPLGQREFLRVKAGLTPGMRPPWAAPHHIVHWGPDNYYSIMEGFRAWKKSRLSPITGATSTG